MSENGESVVAEGMLTVKEAADFSKLSKSELYNLMTRGELASVKHGKRRLVPKRALVDMLAAKLNGGK